MNGAAAQATTIPSPRELVRMFPAWLKKNVPAALMTAVAGGVMGYVSNVWLMAVRYEGSAVPPGSAAAGQGNAVSGGLFWALASSMVFAIAGYWKAVGTKRFFEDIRSLPKVIVELVQSDGHAGRIHLVWGAATAIFASILISPAIGGVLAIGILATAPSVIGSILSTLVYRIWSQVIQKVAPTKHHRTTGMMSMTVGLLGASAALAVTFLFPGATLAARFGIPVWLLKTVLAGALAGIAVMLGRQRPPATVALLILFSLGLVLAHVTGAPPALADDGGYAECGYDFETWLTNCPGTALVLILAILGAIPAAAAAPIGWFIGQLAGNGLGGLGGLGGWDPRLMGPPRGGDRLHVQPRDEGPDAGDRRAIAGWIQQLLNDPAFQDWRRENPQYTGDPSNQEFEAYMRWRRARGLEDPPLILPSHRFRPLPADLPVPEPGEGEWGEEWEDWPPDDGPTLEELINSLFGTDPFGENPNAPGGDDRWREGMPSVDDINAILEGLDGRITDPNSPEGVALRELRDQIIANDGGFSPQMWRDLRNIDNMQAAGIGDRLKGIDNWNSNASFPYPPEIWEQIQELQGQLEANGGRFTPEMLGRLQAIEAAQGRLSGNHLNEINNRLAQDADRGMKFIDDKNKNDLAMEEWNRQLASEIDKREKYIWNKMDEMPFEQWQEAYRDLMNASTSPNPEALDMLRKRTDIVFNNQQGGFAAEGSKARQDSEYWRTWEERAKSVQKAAIAGQILLGPFAIPMTAAGLANLGVFGLGTGLVQGAGVGFTTGGLKGALTEMGRMTLPVNTFESSYKALGAALHPDDPRYKGYGVGDIGLGLISDLGNVLGLKGGMAGLKGMGRVPPDLPVDTAAIRALSNTDPPRVPKTPADAEALRVTANANRLRNDFNELGQEVRKWEQLGNAENAAAARLRQQELAFQIGSNPTAKNQLKNLPLEQQQEVMKFLNPLSDRAIDGMVSGANQSGLTRGNPPRALTADDVFQLRNQKSVARGDLGMDADVAIQQTAQRKLQEEFEAALKRDPYSAEADALRKKLTEQNRLDQFMENGKPISADRANRILQQEYDKAYANATASKLNPGGHSADDAWHMVTQGGHVEAYRDLNILKNNPADARLASQWADQSGSVTSHKKDELLTKVAEGHLTQGEAMTEIARGTAKDIKGKLEPLMEYMGADPAAYARMREMGDFLEQAGTGRYLPSEMDAMARAKFGASIDQLADQVDSNLAAAIKQQGYGGSIGTPGGFQPLAGAGLEALESTGKSILKAEIKGIKPIIKEELHPTDVQPIEPTATSPTRTSEPWAAAPASTASQPAPVPAQPAPVPAQPAPVQTQSLFQTPAAESQAPTPTGSQAVTSRTTTPSLVTSTTTQPVGASGQATSPAPTASPISPTTPGTQTPTQTQGTVAPTGPPTAGTYPTTQPPPSSSTSGSLSGQQSEGAVTYESKLLDSERAATTDAEKIAIDGKTSEGLYDEKQVIDSKTSEGIYEEKQSVESKTSEGLYEEKLATETKISESIYAEKQAIDSMKSEGIVKSSSGFVTSSEGIVGSQDIFREVQTIETSYDMSWVESLNFTQDQVAVRESISWWSQWT